MPTKQKALLLTSKQGALAVGDVDVPTPGPGQLLVKIEATALNPVDWKVHAWGIYVQKFPAILGLDGAGTVEATGKDVEGFATGDRVVYQGVYDNVHTTFQQYGIADAEVVAKIPNNISFDQAASLPVALITAAAGLYEPSPRSSARLTPPWEAGGRDKYAGKPFIVFGGASSVGQLAIQFAKLSGFSPILATASLHNADLLRGLGATQVLDRSLSVDALHTEVARASSAPVGTVFHAISSADTQDAAYSLLAPGGVLVLVRDDELPASKKTANKRVVEVLGNVNLPEQRPFGKILYGHVETLLEKGEIKPNPVEILPGGLGGIVGGMERMQNNLISGKKLIVHPQETT